MDIFVKKTEKLNVNVYAWAKENGDIDATPDKNDIPKDAKDVNTIVFVFRKPSYADSNAILASGRITGDAGTSDVMGFQEGIMRNLLIEIHNGDQVIEARAKDINTLHPSIARAAIGGLLEVVTI